MIKHKLSFVIFVSLFLFTSNLFSKESLRILNWSEYIDVNILKSYVGQKDIQLEYVTYDNNEELIKHLNSKKEFDIIFPSSNYISKFSRENTITKLDYSKIKNHKNIDSYFLNNKNIKDYAIPYFWGTTGIVYDSDKIKISSFSDLWKKDLKDKLFILDDMRDMFAISLITLGFDINTKNENEIKLAYEKLLKLVPNIKGFYTDLDMLSLNFINENCFVSIAYNGDVAELVEEKLNIQFLHPKEGAILWIDTIAITNNTKNKDLAYDFINYLLSKKVSYKNAAEIGYALPIKNYAIDEEIYPNKKQQKKLKSVVYLDKDEKIYHKYWEMFLEKLEEEKGILNEE